MRIKKLVTGPHCFRVFIRVGFSLFCAAPSVVFLRRPQGSKSLLFIHREAEKKGVLISVTVGWESSWRVSGVQDRKKWHHMQESPKEFFIEKETRVPKHQKHRWGIGETCPQFLFTHLSLLPVFSFPPSLTKRNQSSLKEPFHSPFSYSHLTSLLFLHTGKINAGQKPVLS